MPNMHQYLRILHNASICNPVWCPHPCFRALPKHDQVVLAKPHGLLKTCSQIDWAGVFQEFRFAHLDVQWIGTTPDAKSSCVPTSMHRWCGCTWLAFTAKLSGHLHFSGSGLSTWMQSEMHSEEALCWMRSCLVSHLRCTFDAKSSYVSVRTTTLSHPFFFF